MQELINLLPQNAKKSVLVIRLKLINAFCKNYGDIEQHLINK